jgi:hypothetical protein
MKISEEIKEHIKRLGNDFANRESRKELYRLINNNLHGSNVEPDSME